jgi:hypothetical protein
MCRDVRAERDDQLACWTRKTQCNRGGEGEDEGADEGTLVEKMVWECGQWAGGLKLQAAAPSETYHQRVQS